MSKSGPFCTERAGHSLTFVALTCDFTRKSQIVQSGSAGGPAVLGGVGELPIFIIGGERSAGHGEICAGERKWAWLGPRPSGKCQHGHPTTWSENLVDS
jgi:hypothetical protein